MGNSLWEVPCQDTSKMSIQKICFHVRNSNIYQDTRIIWCFAKPSRNVHSCKPELRHHQQSFLPQTSLVLSATGNLELRMVSSAILEHTNGVEPATVDQEVADSTPPWGRQHSFVEIDREIFSTVILSLPLIQEGQLSVSGGIMCTILVNRLED